MQKININIAGTLILSALYDATARKIHGDDPIKPKAKYFIRPPRTMH